MNLGRDFNEFRFFPGSLIRYYHGQVHQHEDCCLIGTRWHARAVLRHESEIICRGLRIRKTSRARGLGGLVSVGGEKLAVGRLLELWGGQRKLAGIHSGNEMIRKWAGLHYIDIHEQSPQHWSSTFLSCFMKALFLTKGRG